MTAMTFTGRGGKQKCLDTGKNTPPQPFISNAYLQVKKTGTGNKIANRCLYDVTPTETCCVFCPMLHLAVTLPILTCYLGYVAVSLECPYRASVDPACSWTYWLTVPPRRPVEVVPFADNPQTEEVLSDCCMTDCADSSDIEPRVVQRGRDKLG